MIRFENVNLDYTGFQMIIPGIKNANMVFGSSGLINIYEEGYLKRNALTDLIAAVRKPDSGEVYVQGIKLSDLDEAKAADYRSRYVTALFRNFQFLEDKTIAENISFYYEIRGVPRHTAVEETNALLQKLHFEEKAQSSPAELNEYERPLLFIAVAFAINRPITVMDGIDYKYNQNAINALVEFSKNHLVIVKSLKDSGIKEVCDRFIIIIDGIITSDTGGTNYSVSDAEVAIMGKKMKLSARTYRSGSMSFIKQLPMYFSPLFLFAFFSAFLSLWINAVFYTPTNHDSLVVGFLELLQANRISNFVFALIAGVFLFYNIFRLTLNQLNQDASLITTLRLAGANPNNIVKIYLIRLIGPAVVFMGFAFIFSFFLPIFNFSWIVSDMGMTVSGTFMAQWLSAFIAALFSFFIVVAFLVFVLKKFLGEKLSKFMVNLNKKKK